MLQLCVPFYAAADAGVEEPTEMVRQFTICLLLSLEEANSF